MNLSLNKEQQLLYFICFVEHGILTDIGYKRLVDNNVFKSRKAVNDALYRLEKKQFMAKMGEWYATSEGMAYIDKIVNGTKANEASHCQDTNPADVIRKLSARINQLEVENNELKKDLANAQKSLQDTVKFWTRKHQAKVEEMMKLEHELTQMQKAQAVNESHSSVNPAYEAGVKAFINGIDILRKIVEAHY